MSELPEAYRPGRGDERDPFHVRIYRSDYLEVDPAWDVSDVYDDFWRLYVNDQAGASVVGAFGDYRLEPGRVHLVPAWVRFDCACVSPTMHLYLHFGLIGLPPALVRQWFDEPMAVPLTSGLRQVIEPLRAHLSGRAAARERWQAALLGKAAVSLALADVMRGWPESGVVQLEAALLGPRAFAPAMRHIEAHLGERISNATLAGLCHMSEGHFIRGFGRSVGQSPQQYVQERRVAAAAHRLIDTVDTIEAIAERTGFADRAHLTRVFARVMGQPPAAYRKAARV